MELQKAFEIRFKSNIEQCPNINEFLLAAIKDNYNKLIVLDTSKVRVLNYFGEDNILSITEIGRGGNIE